MFENFLFFRKFHHKMQNTPIRPATSGDVPVIAQLARQIWPVAYKEILSSAQLDYMLHLFYRPESLQKQISKGQQFFLIEAPLPVGFAAIGPIEAPLWKLHKLYVLPEWQGKGLGKKLLNHVIAAARNAGAAGLTLQVNRFNPAQDFYRREGFHVIAEKDFDIGEGFFMNDFVMKKKL